MNPFYIAEELKALEQGVFDLIKEVKERYDLTNIQTDEVMDLLFNLQSAITTAKEYTQTLMGELEELEELYQAEMILNAEPITGLERGSIRWR